MKRSWVGLWLVTLLGCAPSDETTVGPELPPAFAKAATGVSVTTADPAFGRQGEASKQVRIQGSGFEPGDQASWQRNGAADPGISVVSTQFVSNTELVATITIAGDATLAFYDIAVLRPGRKGGIGTMMFEVTTATAIPSLGNGTADVSNGLNDAGQIVGHSGGRAFFWSQASGITDLGAGTAYDLDGSGTRIVGSTSLNNDGQAVLWTATAGAWNKVALSTTCAIGAQSGAAHSIAPDGQLVGGVIRVSVGKNKVSARPALWALPAGSCTLLPMPAGYAALALVNDVNSTGTAVGMAMGSSGGTVAVIWNDGVPTVLGAGGARTISEDASLVAGQSGGMPVFWRWTGSAWSPPITLTSTCGNYSGDGWANDVNASGVIVGKDCSGRARQWIVSGTTIVSTSLLPGLGPPGGGRAEAVNNGTVPGIPGIVGATSDRAVYWPMQ